MPRSPRTRHQRHAFSREHPLSLHGQVAGIVLVALAKRIQFRLECAHALGLRGRGPSHSQRQGEEGQTRQQRHDENASTEIASTGLGVNKNRASENFDHLFPHTHAYS